jgi:hypothetical protein
VSQDDAPENTSWSERMSQVGIVVIAIAACAAAWLVMSLLL